MLPLSWYLSQNAHKTRQPSDGFQWFTVAPGANWMPAQTPGPGHYEVPRDSVYVPIRYHTIQDRPPTNYRTISSNIDYPTDRVFPTLRPLTIGIRQKLEYFQFDDTPAPALPQPSPLPAGGLGIGCRLNRSVLDAEIPPPGRYDPNRKSRPVSVVQMNRGTARGDIWSSTVDSPAPGTYDPSPPLEKPKHWTVRLRKVKPIPVIQLNRTLQRADWQSDQASSMS
jgi:hypothetical protein